MDVHQKGVIQIWYSQKYHHVTGKIERVRHGPSPVLTEEESELISWVVKMAEIGYGQTRIQVTEMVKKILDWTGRPNPFQDNHPGKDWWYMFLHRYPEVSLKTPSSTNL